MSMNLPNKLTMFRVVLIPVFIVVLMSGLIAEPASRYIAVIIFCVASFTDYLDGHIARKYNLVPISENLWIRLRTSFLCLRQ